MAFSFLTKRILSAVAGGSVLLYWFVHRDELVLALINSSVWLLDAFLGERATCSACGASLQKEIGDGWR